MAYSPQMTAPDITKTYHRLVREFGEKPFCDVIAQWRGVVKKYYACFPLLLRMGILMINYYTLENDEKKRETLLRETADIFGRVRRESDDVWLKKQANSLEAFCHIALNEPQKALSLLDESMKPPVDDSLLLAQAYFAGGNAQRAKLVLQVSMYLHLAGLTSAGQSYLSLMADDPEGFGRTLSRLNGLAGAFNIEKLNPNSLCVICLTAAHGYATRGEKEKALEMLSEYASICTTSLIPFKLKGDDFFDAIDEWLADYDPESPRDEKAIKASIVASVAQNPAFAALHDEPAYKNVIHVLETFANGPCGGKV
jgi:hypothetical protein